MKLHQPLDDLLRGKGTLHVLRVLCRSPQEGFAAPDLARRGGLALSHVQGALALLESHGLVDRRVAGRTHLWSIVSGNVLVPPLKGLFDVERGLSEQLQRDLADGLRRTPVRRALLFGSVSRGEEKGWSDVDVLIELRKAADRERVWDSIIPLASQVRGRYGLNLAPIVLAPSEERGAMSPSFLATVNREGKVIKEAA